MSCMADRKLKVVFGEDEKAEQIREVLSKAFSCGIASDAEGENLISLIRKAPEKLEEYVGIYVDLLKKIHSVRVRTDSLPSHKERMLRWGIDIRPCFDDRRYIKLLALIRGIPERDHMIHGDFLPDRVLVSDETVSVVFHGETLAFGDPILEIATIYNALKGYLLFDRSHEAYLGISSELSAEIWQSFLRQYCGTTDPVILGEMEKKAQLIGALRLYRWMMKRRPEEKELIQSYRDLLFTLIDELEALTYSV